MTKEHTLSQNTLLIDIPPDLYDHLYRVAMEMDITREELVIKILNQWKRDNRVVTGDQSQLCQLSLSNPSPYSR